MRITGSAKGRFQIDWLISNLRWLLLVSVALVSLVGALLHSGELPDFRSTLPHILILIIAALYNLFVMLWLLYGTPRPVLPVLTLVIDTALSIGFVLTSGGTSSPLLFFALFPVLTAALRFKWAISVLAAGLVVFGTGGIDCLLHADMPILPRLLTFSAPALVLLLAALVSGQVAHRIKRALLQQSKIEEEEELGILRAAHQRARLVFSLASTLSATLNYRKVLEATIEVAEAGLNELGQPGMAHLSMVLLIEGEHLQIVASRHLSQHDQKVEFRGLKGALGETLSTAEPVILHQPSSDPELGQVIGMHSCRQAVVVPLRAGFENYGAVVLGSTHLDPYTEDHVDLLVAICNQAILALQNALLYQSLTEEKERIVAVEEDARRKLSRDLHDGPTQSIAAIAMRLNYTRVLLDRAPAQVGEELVQIEELARQTTKDIRHMLFTLRPLILETQGLSAALEQYVSKLEETERRVRVHLDTPPDLDHQVDRNIQGVTFYIIDEAIGNARKHAQANNIWVKIALQNNNLHVEVIDDGRGFDVESVQLRYDERGSLGLLNMRERAELINGRLSIASALGSGTRIRLVAPTQGKR
ncbi:MAG: GAF domain-containing protein [Chloroflexi bacterium]|nr:GAF domain-containing protein [Chloroflexota bacterium]